MAEIIITRGSDKTLELTWNDADGEPINLTGHSIGVFDVEGLSASKITATIVNANTGRFDVKIEGSTPISVGDKSFRVQITPTGGDSTASPEIPFKVV
jgi:hypothetical protein